MNPYVNSLNGWGGGFIAFWPSQGIVEEPTGSAGGRRRTLSLPVSAPKVSKRVDSISSEISDDFEEDKKQLEALLDRAEKIDAFDKAELRAKARAEALEEAEIREKILRALEAEFLEKRKRLEEEEILLLLMMMEDE